MTTQIPDALAAVRALLAADPDVATLTGGRVFGRRLPDAEARHMPRTALVLIRSGGGVGVGNRSFIPILSWRLDVRAYGPSGYEAASVWAAAHAALKQYQGGDIAGCRIYSVTVEIGPMDMNEPDGLDWPLLFASYQVMTGETPA